MSNSAENIKQVLYEGKRNKEEEKKKKKVNERKQT